MSYLLDILPHTHTIRKFVREKITLSSVASDDNSQQVRCGVHNKIVLHISMTKNLPDE